MKLMFISDLHGGLPATQIALQRFAESEAKWLIILGDFLNHGPRNPLPEGYAPAQVAECLNTIAGRIIGVRGNCDSEVDQMLLNFPMMTEWQQVLLPNQRFFLTHGHHYSAEHLPPLMAGDILVSGHTHLPVAQRYANIFLFNPGSISLPKGGYPASYGLFDGDALAVHTLNDNRMIAQVKITP